MQLSEDDFVLNFDRKIKFVILHFIKKNTLFTHVY